MSSQAKKQKSLQGSRLKFHQRNALTYLWDALFGFIRLWSVLIGTLMIFKTANQIDVGINIEKMRRC